MNFETTKETMKLTHIATEPKPSGDIPNHQSDLLGITASNQPSLYLHM